MQKIDSPGTWWKCRSQFGVCRPSRQKGHNYCQNYSILNQQDYEKLLQPVRLSSEFVINSVSQKSQFQPQSQFVINLGVNF